MNVENQVDWKFTNSVQWFVRKNAAETKIMHDLCKTQIFQTVSVAYPSNRVLNWTKRKTFVLSDNG